MDGPDRWRAAPCGSRGIVLDSAGQGRQQQRVRVSACLRSGPVDWWQPPHKSYRNAPQFERRSAARCELTPASALRHDSRQPTGGVAARDRRSSLRLPQLITWLSASFRSLPLEPKSARGVQGHAASLHQSARSRRACRRQDAGLSRGFSASKRTQNICSTEEIELGTYRPALNTFGNLQRHGAIG